MTRRVDVDDRVYMLVDELPTQNVYTVYDGATGAVMVREVADRLNRCSVCGKAVPKTHLHHVKFDPEHPSQNTVEVCDGPNSCHERLHKPTGRSL
jgi:hypothetical protein